MDSYMKVLITGHKGFVGRHFFDEISKTGHEIMGIDIVDGIDCKDFFDKSNDVYDYVFHFACYTEPSTSLKNIKGSNIGYDLAVDSSLFSWSLKTKQKNIIYFSSSAVYPICLQNNPNYKLKESDVSFDLIRKPDNIYGWTKLTGEYLANYVKSQGVNVYIFRPFSIYGEDQDSTFVFNRYLEMAIRKEKNIEIWGDGNQTRDFINIKDVVRAVTKCVFANIETPINIGSGNSLSINNLVEIFSKEFDWNPNIRYLFDRPVGTKFRCSDCEKLNNFYKPEYTVHDFVKQIKRNMQL